MRLKPEFVSAPVADQTVLVPTGESDFHGVVRGNKTFAAIVELLRDETTEEALVAAIRERFDAPEGAVEADVARALAELRKVGALEEVA